MKAFGSFHPAVLLTYFVAIIGIFMFASNPVMRVTALLGGILFCLLLQKKREIPGNLGFYIPLFLLVAVTNPLFSHAGVTPLFFLNGNPVTLEASVYGVFLAVTVIGVMMWCKCYSEIMTGDKFLYLFGSIVPKLSLTLSMAFRFLPLFVRRMKTVTTARRGLGLYSQRGFVDRIKGTGQVFLSVISWSLENAMETSMSMRARAYGKAKRTSFSLFRFTMRDGVMISVTLLLFALTVTGMASGATDFFFYPRIGELSLSPLAVTAYSSFAILAFLPFVIEVRGALLWRYYISRI